MIEARNCPSTGSGRTVGGSNGIRRGPGDVTSSLRPILKGVEQASDGFRLGLGEVTLQQAITILTVAYFECTQSSAPRFGHFHDVERDAELEDLIVRLCRHYVRAAALERRGVGWALRREGAGKGGLLKDVDAPGLHTANVLAFRLDQPQAAGFHATLTAWRRPIRRSPTMRGQSSESDHSAAGR